MVIDYLKALWAIKDLNTPFGALTNWLFIIVITLLVILFGYILYKNRELFVAIIGAIGRFLLSLIGINLGGSR